MTPPKNLPPFRKGGSSSLRGCHLHRSFQTRPAQASQAKHSSTLASTCAACNKHLIPSSRLIQAPGSSRSLQRYLPISSPTLLSLRQQALQLNSPKSILVDLTVSPTLLAMGDTAKAIQALKESRPPATDNFTYLTLIEQFLSPEILPTLNEILQDASLTSEIGWDLVDKLAPLQGSEQVLETVARLGNPRECIIKVLEVLEALQVPAEKDNPEDLTLEDGDEAKGKQQPISIEEANRRFITLLGMLAILHKRIKTKYPSRFLASSLLTIYKTYQPNQEQTASVLNLVHSLSGQRARPPLPQRKSSVNVANPDHDGDASKNAPDPEADHEGDSSDEDEIQRRLLLSFTSCVLESYVGANDMSWSRRLLEFYSPDKIVPGRKTATQAFRDDQELSNRDAMVGKLVVSD